MNQASRELGGDTGQLMGLAVSRNQEIRDLKGVKVAEFDHFRMHLFLIVDVLTFMVQMEL